VIFFICSMLAFLDRFFGALDMLNFPLPCISWVSGIPMHTYVVALLAALIIYPPLHFCLMHFVLSRIYTL
jgi:hypothetical protein